MTRAATWRTPLVVLLAGGAVLALGIGIRQAFGLFLGPMSRELGWGREVFAFGIAVQNLVWGASQPFLGGLADRFGGGRVVAVSGLAYAAGLFLMANAGDPLAFHLSAGLLVGLALSGVSFAVVLGAVGRAYPPQRRSAALGLCAAGGSLGQFLIVPAGQALIAQYGWLMALSLIAALALLAVPLSTALAGQPAATGPRQSFRQALAEAGGHSGYRLLIAGFFVCGFHITFIGTHLPAYLGDRGLNPTEAANALALIGLFNIAGSLGCGYLGGAFSKKYVLSAVYALRALAILAFLLAPSQPATAYVFAAVMGLLWLGTVPLTSALVAQIFGPAYLGALFGLVFFSHQVGAFVGVWLGGYVFDAAGSYDAVWWLAILLGVLAAVLHLPIKEAPVMRPRPAAGAS